MTLLSTRVWHSTTSRKPSFGDQVSAEKSPFKMFNIRRREASFRMRLEAAELARERPLDISVSNGEEYLYRDANNVPLFLGSFTKGLRHLDDGQVANPDDYAAFVKACDSGNEIEISRLALGPLRDDKGFPIWRSNIAQTARGGLPATVRGWASMGAGLAFDLEGPDAQVFAIPPAPKLTSPELQAEMAEAYLMALARDIPISEWSSPKHADFFEFATGALNNLPWFEFPEQSAKTPAEKARVRGRVTVSNIFRGITPGANVGPYLSQYLLLGSKQITQNDPKAELQGKIQYGAISIHQKIGITKPYKDYMTTRDVFLDVQDGADLRDSEEYDDGERFITTPRDLAHYVHYDALYQAYLNACLILLANKVPFDAGVPFLVGDQIDKQEGFATFGGPYILSLVTEVATRALKAIRYQKFNVHRRIRPEAVGGFIDEHLRTADSDDPAFPEIRGLVSGLLPILQRIEEHNREQNRQYGDQAAEIPSYLLPMAFAEGSPMHPSYGSGHAVVAGACVTTLKAFFDSNTILHSAHEVDPETGHLRAVELREPLTVAGELNKLAENIAIGRNWGGVHWFTDYYESMLLGEKIAIGILEEHRLQFGENYSLTLPKFDGTSIRI